MKTIAIALMTLLPASAFAAEEKPEPKEDHVKLTKLSLDTSAGWLTSGGGNGAALGAGARLAVGRHFALGLDLGYGLMATPNSTMQDRWWFVPTMAGVMPARIAGRDFTFDVGAGLGLGTASGYSGGWAEYSSHPFSASWEFQLMPTVRAHAIASMKVSPTMDVFFRADAAALVLPRGSNASMTDSTWVLVSVGTRFDLL
jgi:hypothetical protein